MYTHRHPYTQFICISTHTHTHTETTCCSRLQCRRLHGSSLVLLGQCNTEESAHTLTSPLACSLQLHWPLFLFPFPFSSHHTHTHTHTEKGLSRDDNRGWDCKLKVPPTVRAVYKHELTGYTLLLPHSDWPGNSNYGVGLHHGRTIRAGQSGMDACDWNRQEEEEQEEEEQEEEEQEEESNCQSWKDMNAM